jgi:hypothetical protein
VARGERSDWGRAAASTTETAQPFRYGEARFREGWACEAGVNWRECGVRTKILIPLLVLVVAVLVVTLRRRDEEPEEPPTGQWYKGNTHTHSLWSDGNDFPEMIVDWYKEQGYDFLGLSDHNLLSEGEKWMKVTDAERRRKVKEGSTMEGYVERFGEDWVETRTEGAEVRLKTLEEFRPLFEKEGEFLLLQAEEISDRFQKWPIHINAVNLEEAIKPQGGDSVVEVMRNNLRAVEEQAERLGRPILTHLNHPNFHYAISAQQLAEVLEEQFFEVYNGHPGINHLGNDENPGAEAIWDLASTLRMMVYEAPPLFGVATDDSHNYHGGNVSPGRGWVMVQAEKLEAESLVEAMERGDFYASSGVELKTVHFDRQGRELRLEIAGQEGVTYETKFVGTRRSTPEEAGEVFATVSGTAPSFAMKGDELYVRAVVTSSREHPNPSFEGQQEQGWTQPVGWRK